MHMHIARVTLSSLHRDVKCIFNEPPVICTFLYLRTRYVIITLSSLCIGYAITTLSSDIAVYCTCVN